MNDFIWWLLLAGADEVCTAGIYCIAMCFFGGIGAGGLLWFIKEIAGIRI